MNILILGETGVGKSTWINGFINYLTFESLDTAADGDLCTLIPTKFTVCDKNFEEVTVSTGSDKNEVLHAGQSATQDTKVYQFTLGDTTISLIDTPGIGDTRGIEQDKRNFENILTTLSNLDELHGICILLKPNNARLNVMFRFCIKELLTYMHRDASKNIMFCFTNCRGTFYRPGDTMPALQNLLQENNKNVKIPVSRDTVYCYDSEAYRFLVALKNDPPVNFPEEEKVNFINSWTKSFNETKRMLDYIKGLPPHNIKSTLNLNHVRQMVLKLSGPLADISRNIQTNKSIVEDEKRDIEKTMLTIEELKKKRMTTRTVIETRPLSHPKLVCTNAKCTKVWTVDNVSTVVYETVCHTPCMLGGVTGNSIGDPGIMECSAIFNGACVHYNCKHSYREHMRVMYDSVQVVKQFEDEAVMESLKRNQSAAEMKEKMIQAKNKEVEEYQRELKKIELASVKFAHFLKSNAITPYNDAMEEYLKHLIREEEDKQVGSGESKSTLNSLKKNMESYLAQKQLLEQGIDTMDGDEQSEDPTDLVEVEKFVNELQQLKHSGESLKEALNCMEKVQRAVFQETVVRKVNVLSMLAYAKKWRSKKIIG